MLWESETDIFLKFLTSYDNSNTADMLRRNMNMNRKQDSAVIGVREGVSGVSGDTPVGLETSGSLEVS